MLERLGHEGVGQRSQHRAASEGEREGEVLLWEVGEHPAAEDDRSGEQHRGE